MPPFRHVPERRLRDGETEAVAFSRWIRGWPWPWIGTVARVALGVVWIIAGALKVGDLAASGRAVVAYRLFPPSVATTIGAVLPFLEIALGALLVLGLATRLSAIVSAVLLVAYIIGIASVWARGLRIDCGCFGSGGDLGANAQPTYFSETIRDIGLLVVAVYLVVRPRTRLSLDALLA
jgi:uncharacterized membrane protein YphA (DoxX/SURF4 family)